MIITSLFVSCLAQDSLILEKSDMHHPVCSFQDDFQEFEMIDDEDNDEEEEEDEEVDHNSPPSPFASPPYSPTLGTLKSRPTTLNLTTAVSQVSQVFFGYITWLLFRSLLFIYLYFFFLPQDSLNNNSNPSPKKGSWQDSLRNTTTQGTFWDIINFVQCIWIHYIIATFPIVESLLFICLLMQYV